MQTRLQSLIESCVNVAIGYFVALLGQFAVFPLYGLEVNLAVNLQIGAWFTAISIARSYFVRRGFNWFHHYSPARVGVDRTPSVSPPDGGAGGRVSL